MKNGSMILFFPQWQGSGPMKDIYCGSVRIRDEYFRGYEYFSVDVCQNEGLTVEKKIFGYRQILNHLINANNILRTRKPGRIFTIGGDCGVELAPVSYLNKRYHGDLTVLWFDAHADLNTPETSPSQYFHGMPLRFLLGDGEKTILERSFSTLTPHQIILAGTRDLDPPEKNFIAVNNINSLSAKQILDREDCIIEMINSKHPNNVYIHLDLDVLEPNTFPYALCLSPEGIVYERLIDIFEKIWANFNIVGYSIVEYAAKNNDGLKKLKDLFRFGHRL